MRATCASSARSRVRSRATATSPESRPSGSRVGVRAHSASKLPQSAVQAGCDPDHDVPRSIAAGSPPLAGPPKSTVGGWPYRPSRSKPLIASRAPFA